MLALSQEKAQMWRPQPGSLPTMQNDQGRMCFRRPEANSQYFGCSSCRYKYGKHPQVSMFPMMLVRC